MSGDGMNEVAFHVPSALLERLEKLASVLECDRDTVMRFALEEYLATVGADALADADGLAELDRGDAVLLGDTVMKAHAIVRAASSRGKRVG